MEEKDLVVVPALGAALEASAGARRRKPSPSRWDVLAHDAQCRAPEFSVGAAFGHAAVEYRASGERRVAKESWAARSRNPPSRAGTRGAFHLQRAPGVPPRPVRGIDKSP